MVTDTPKHYPVLLNELISIITPQHGGTFIDCTFGQGGYTEKILSFKNTEVIALDRDLQSKKIAEKVLDKYQSRFLFRNKRFSQLENLKLKNKEIRGVIFDLGFSYSQVKDLSKGLSFNFTGDLNMRMGLNDFSARDVINKLDLIELEKIFKFFGDEKEAKQIASRIIEERKSKVINTEILVNIIDKTKKKKILELIVQQKFFKH